MKIKRITPNNRRKAFEVQTHSKTYLFPYARLDICPSPENRVVRVYVDKELDNEAFTYELESGDEGTVHIDHVLEYNRDPRYLRDLLLYKLTLAAQQGVERSALSKRELTRRLGTSPAQFYRLLDPTNTKKSIDQMTALLHVVDCEVDLVVKENRMGLRKAI